MLVDLRQVKYHVILVKCLWAIHTRKYGVSEKDGVSLNEPSSLSCEDTTKRAPLINDEYFYFYYHRYNRINAVDTACYYGNEDCLANATREYNEYMSDDINEK